MLREPVRAATVRGIVFLIASVTCFGLVDGLSKVLIKTQSFGQIMLARYIVALVALLVLTGPGNWRSLFRTRSHGLQITRGLTPLIIGGSMVFAVKFLPLAEATTVLFAGPFIVVALSGVALGERVSPASWIGVAAGFIGVLIVARPGFSDLSLYTIFPAVGALFYAVLQLLSRHLGARGERPSTSLAWTLLMGTLVALPISIVQWLPMTGKEWLLSLCLGAVFGGGQYFLAKAYTLAPANLLAPFAYLQILAAAVFGVAVFGDVPDRWTIIGILVIIAAGAYVLGRTKR